jgi:flagellar basal-body rod modification protein FlgD
LGEYQITISGQDAGGASVAVKTEISGRVDGVDLTGSEPILAIGEIRVALSKVKGLSRPAAN